MKTIRLSSDEMLAKLRPVDDLKVVDINEYRIIISPDTMEACLVFKVYENEYILPIHNLESVVASYHIHGFAKNAHIPDVYSNYMHLMRETGFTLNKAILEAKHGDVVYGRLVWKDAEGKLVSQVVTPGDVFIFAQDLNIKPGIVSTLIEEMPTIDEWPYHYDIEDY